MVLCDGRIVAQGAKNCEKGACRIKFSRALPSIDWLDSDREENSEAGSMSLILSGSGRKRNARCYSCRACSSTELRW